MLLDILIILSVHFTRHMNYLQYRKQQVLEEQMMNSRIKKTYHRNSILSINDSKIFLFISFSLLYLISRQNYPLFHFILETATMIIGFCMLAICINTDATSDNSFYTLLGIAYGFVSFINFFHIASNNVTGILKYGNLNYSTQLRIIMMFMESISLLIATFYIDRKINIRITFYGYFMVSIIFIILTYVLRVFPTCYIVGVGLTNFKKFSEYIIILILVAVEIILYLNKECFPGRLFRLLIMSLLFTQISDLLSTMFVNREDWPNIWSHMFKLFSFSVIYIAVVQTAFRNPTELFYKKLEEKNKELLTMNDALQRSNAELIESREIINKQKIEDEKEKLRIEFFSNISHELRTPINIIYSILQLKESNKKNKKEFDFEKYFNTIKQNCFRLLRITNNLIDITKVDSGYFKPEFHRENIVELVENITLSTVSYAESKGISIVFDTSDEEIYISCDSDLIERIILNLLSNSVKYGKDGGEITVDILKTDQFVQIAVKDDGIGIPEDKKAQIFDRFMQVDKTFRRTSEGSGIGLSLVKAFVEMQSGSILFRSKEGVGTEFIIQFPLVSTDSCKRENIELNMQNNTINKAEIELSDIYYD